MTDTIIVGGGPAGLTAAIYVRRGGRSATVIECASFGGQIVTSPLVENYPGISKISGFDLAMNLIDQATDLGVELETDRILSISKEDDHFVLKGESDTYQARSVIVSTGAKCRELGLDNEQSLIGNGVSYCALCDGAFFKGKDVVVNGGGNSAVEEAQYLADICKSVTLVHRREEFRADSKEVDKLRAKSNVIFKLNYVISALNGQNELNGVVIRNVHSGEEQTIPAEGLFVSIGRVPDTEAVSLIVDRDEKGYIRATESCQTNIPGLFVAGDCRTKSVRQLTTATGDGAVAGTAALHYLNR